LSDKLKSGLSGSAIKYIAVVLMVLDHIHQMFYARGAPVWLTWLGRPVLPVFLFMCAEGFAHTSGRGRYLLRLFTGFECMNAASLLLRAAMPVEGVALINNAFQTMLLCAMYMMGIETMCAGVLEKRPLKAALSAGLMLLPVAAGLCVILASDPPRRLLLLLCGVVPNVLTTEGGAPAVLLGVAFYLLRRKPAARALALAALSAAALLLQLKNGCGLFGGGAQWLMVFAAVPMLLYNGSRGNGGKYFFYIFYPAHVYLLYGVAWLLSQKL